jgi:hypothetical protein
VLDRLATDAPELSAEIRTATDEALAAARAIDLGYTVDADGVIRPPA